MLQKDIFLKGEGDCYLERNLEAYTNQKEELNDLYRPYEKYVDSSMKVLEIGCCNGQNLDYFYRTKKCECYGVDPSEKAVEQGLRDYGEINLKVGTADFLDFEDDFFDVVIFGFCLYLVDSKFLTKVVSEVDRVLKNEGILGITDFDLKHPLKKNYKHHPDIFVHKYDYSKIFLSFPQYILLEKMNRAGSAKNYCENIEERCSTQILLKDFSNAYIQKK